MNHLLRLLSCLFLGGSLLITNIGCSSIIGAASDGPVTSDRGERTWGAAIDDEQIETLALVNLGKANPALADAHVSVTSYNAIVLLTGQVTSDSLRTQAGQTVGNINRVRQVYNELQIQGESSLLARSNDSWLTSKVKSKLLVNGDIESGRIKIVTENGTVFMMGLLTRIEADQAVDVVRNTGGVQKVVKVFEYID